MTCESTLDKVVVVLMMVMVMVAAGRHHRRRRLSRERPPGGTARGVRALVCTIEYLLDPLF